MSSLGAGSSPSRSHAIRSTSGVDHRVLPDGARQLPDPQPGEGTLDPPSVAVQPERPSGKLQPEGGRLGVDAVGAAHAERVAVLLGARDDHAERPLQPLQEKRAGLLDGE